MTFPVGIPVGDNSIPVHLVADVLSIFVGYKYFIHLYRKTDDHISFKNRWSIMIGGVVGGFLGSKLLAALENPSLFIHPPELLYYVANKTIIGGVVGAILGVEIAKKIIKESKSSGDLFVYPLILAILIGRVGCFLTGVSDGTVGDPSSLPWAFDQGDGIPRHPTSLYEIIFLLALWPLLMYFDKKGLENGVRFRLFIVFYLGFRFLIEFIKPGMSLALGVNAIQWTCLIAVVYYSASLIKNKLRSTLVV